MYRWFSFILFLFLNLFQPFSSLMAHGGHHSYVHNDVSVHVRAAGWRGGHPHWYHDRVYYTDPWYHPNHVYIYGGDPYAIYYYGYPYYYFDPRFYYYN